MKTMINSIVLTLILVFGFTVHAQTTTWTGATDSDYDTSTNWTSGVPGASSGLINAGAIVHVASGGGITAQVTQTGGTTTWAGSRYLNVGAVWNINGGTFDLGTVDQLRLNGGELHVNGGSITNTASTGLIRIYDSASIFSTTSDFNLADTLVDQRLGSLVIDAADVSLGRYLASYNAGTAALLSIKNGSSLSILSSGSETGEFKYNAATEDLATIDFGSGVNSLNAVTATNMGRFLVNFASDAVGSSMTFTSGMLDQTAWESEWSAGNLTVGGGNSGTFSENFTLTGTTLTLIPEPSTFTLLGGAFLIGIVMLRRRCS